MSHGPVRPALQQRAHAIDPTVRTGLRAGTSRPAHLSGVAMHLIHEELARHRALEAHREAELQSRRLRLLAARRWQRRAEHASRRARLATAAIR